MRATVADHDRGWKALVERVKRLTAGEPPAVTIGVQGQQAAEERTTDEGGVITAVVLAGVHEFGSDERGIPERSFIRSTIDGNQNEYQRSLERVGDLVLKGKLEPKQGLGLLGEKVKSDIQTTIEDGIEPPLAKRTIESKIERGLGPGPHTPLIETGQLKNSITYAVRGA